jgi:hypothetical protein
MRLFCSVIIESAALLRRRWSLLLPDRAIVVASCSKVNAFSAKVAVLNSPRVLRLPDESSGAYTADSRGVTAIAALLRLANTLALHPALFQELSSRVRTTVQHRRVVLTDTDTSVLTWVLCSGSRARSTPLCPVLRASDTGTPSHYCGASVCRLLSSLAALAAWLALDLRRSCAYGR